MQRRALPRVMAFFVLAAGVLGACGDDAPATVPFTLGLSPQFVPGAVGGARTGVLVTITNASPTGDPVEVTATAAGAEVIVEPDSIGAGEVAEVWVVPGPPAADGATVEIVVSARRGEFEETATRPLTVYSWEDDRGGYTGDLLAVFTAWLAEQRPDLGIGSGTVFAGSFIAPELLVVSHYLYVSDEWEIGLSWHVMIPPDDWAEVYLRPRGEPAPTLAFRLASQAAALQDGIVEVTEVPPPSEVVR